MTFSIVGLDKINSKLGVAVSTAMPNVGNTVPHVEPGLVAIATQASSNRWYGPKGIKLLQLGLSPENALKTLLKEDDKKESRQIFYIDHKGRCAAHTGLLTKSWSGHIIGDDFVAGGNILTSSKVVEKMADSFKSSDAPLEEKLMSSLEAGWREGGDSRGLRSSSLLVEFSEYDINGRPFMNLRVDDHDDPIGELKRLLSVNQKYRVLLDAAQGEK